MYIKISYFCRIRNLPHKLQKNHRRSTACDVIIFAGPQRGAGTCEALLWISGGCHARCAMGNGLVETRNTNELAKTWNET